MIYQDRGQTPYRVIFAILVALLFSKFDDRYLFDLMLKRFDVFERVDDDFVSGLIHGLYFDIDERLLA
jgi:hypothetical protein